ncbi:PREDICTED: uncharacterized protein LOC104487310 [Chlamydotis macqueenii]|nr:PREDICTED: uncharacterized protein LOC104487310 [Chlamydotis macqueenii]
MDLWRCDFEFPYRAEQGLQVPVTVRTPALLDWALPRSMSRGSKYSHLATQSIQVTHYAALIQDGVDIFRALQKITVCNKIPKKLLHETQPRPTNYHGFQKPHFPLRPRALDPNVIGDDVFLSDVSPSNIGRALPAEKKKGRSATFYPLDNTPFLLPVDETQPPALNSSMEPVGVSTEMALLSNILAAYAFITENPERAALYFVSGVCIGLVLTLLALVLRVSCRTDCKRSPAKKPPRERESDSDSSDSDDDSDTTSDLSARRHRRFERTLNMNVFTSAEELERAQRLEERERIIREIWMNGQPDIPGTRSLNRYY